jgi:hypothetical protein
MTSNAIARAIAVTGLVAVAACVGAPAYGSSGGVPFTDPAADGYIGICDLAGHNVTSGTVDSAPFVWKAVSSVTPPKAYRGKGQNTGLFIYQVRQGVEPGDWSGDELSSDSIYSRAAEPTAALTYKDESLKVFMTEYPPMWDGLYALRMQFGKSGYGVYGATYPMTVIQVTGSTWRVVSGGLVNCSRATGVSQETVSAGIAQRPAKPVKGETAVTAPVALRALPGTALSSRTTSATAASPGTSGQGGLATSAADPISAPVSLASQSDGGGSQVLIVVLVVGAVAVAGVAGAAVGRQRSERRSE